MIEKIMKAVKSGNKKRGRNITIGAVVGMLLSCTVVMGTTVEDIELEIKNDGEIIFVDKDGVIFIPGEEGDPYPDNKWKNNTYTNATIISGENPVGDGYGIKIENLGADSNFSLINKGLIIGEGKNTSSYAIKILSSTTVKDITNTGLIIGKKGSGYSYGISNEGLITGILTNNGLITGTEAGQRGYGIDNEGSIEILINNGLITGYGGNTGADLIINDHGSIEKLINNGLITAKRATAVNNLYGTITTLINTGVLSGGNNAIDNSFGDMNSINNYGLLVSEGSTVVESYGGATTNFEKKYGLAFKVVSDKYVLDSTYSGEFGKAYTDTIVIGYEKKENGESNLDKEIKGTYTIINAKAKESSSDVIGTESLMIKNGKLSYEDSASVTKEENIDSDKKYILNGITDTLFVSIGENNQLDNSMINAYKTAIKFNDDGGNLTLSGTIVNGGADRSSTVIAGGNGADTLTLQNGTIINGIIDGGTGNDTLNFGDSAIVKAKSALNNDEIGILYNISGFENINVNSNVTFYEKTLNAAGEVKSLEIKDVENLIIGKNGVLTLRIDTTNSNAHALSSNMGGNISSEGGKLLLALNGAGNEDIISFGDTILGDGLDANTLGTTSKLHTLKKLTANEVEVIAVENLPDEIFYEQLNKIYHGILSVEDLIGNFNVDDDTKLLTFLGYLNDIYAGNPYSYSSELSRKSAGMFRDIVTENIFRPETNKWMIYGALTHVDGGTKDTYYGKGYYTTDIGSSDMDADTKITGAYMLGEYGVSNTLTSGVVIGGNKLKSDLSNGSKVDGSALYLGAYAKKYVGNLKVTVGAGFQYGDYDADRLAVNKVASDSAESVMKYSDNYNDMTYDIYLNGRYSHNIGKDLFLEPYATLSYTYVDQDGADEGNTTLAIETDSKSFDYTVGKVGVDLKKVIPHEKGKSTLSAGISYTKILDGADEEHITGRFKGGSNFDILVAHKNEHSIGLNAKYALELENGVIFDVKGTYSVERDSHNQSGKNRTKGEWIVGAGLGYKF